jgi:leader peptidase (prepilin peptidase) / N-methyltransferase
VTAAFVAACGGLGLLLGWYLPVLVTWAAGEDEVRCSPWVTAPATGLLYALLAWRVGASAILPAYLYLAAIGVALVVIDLAVHRLPDRLTLPSYPIVAVLLVAASAVEGEWAALARAAIGAGVLYGAYYLVAVVAPGGMGFGDVKLAGVLGAALAWPGWAPLIVGAFLGFLYGGLVSGALLVARRATRKTRVPFGPFMVAGALTAVCLGEAAATTYLISALP